MDAEYWENLFGEEGEREQRDLRAHGPNLTICFFSAWPRINFLKYYFQILYNLEVLHTNLYF